MHAVSGAAALPSRTVSVNVVAVAGDVDAGEHVARLDAAPPRDPDREVAAVDRRRACRRDRWTPTGCTSVRPASGATIVGTGRRPGRRRRESGRRRRPGCRARSRRPAARRRAAGGAGVGRGSPGTAVGARRRRRVAPERRAGERRRRPQLPRAAATSDEGQQRRAGGSGCGGSRHGRRRPAPVRRRVGSPRRPSAGRAVPSRVSTRGGCVASQAAIAASWPGGSRSRRCRPGASAWRTGRRRSRASSPSGQEDALLREVDASARRPGRRSTSSNSCAVRLRVDDDRQQRRSSARCCGRCRRTRSRGWPGCPTRVSAHGACSRDEPAPKLSPRAGSGGPAISGRSSTNGGSLRAAVRRRSASRGTARRARPSLSVDLEVAGRDDLVGVDVLGRQRDDRGW